MMKTLGVRELIERIDEILRLVAEKGETIEVTEDDEVIARVVPVQKRRRPGKKSNDEAWSDLHRLAKEISTHWKDDMSAVEAVRDVRQDL
jgi:antitoxin (DNA-binding transcriptional repressor) of toxin-antitoxin stability system